MTTTRFGYTRWAFRKDLFRSMSLNDTLLKDSFSFSLVHKILLLFTGSYQLLYLLRKEYLQSIQCLEATLQVF